MIWYKYPPLQLSPAKESGTGPSLGCALQEENGYTKRKNGRFSGIGQPFFLVIFVLQERSKGTSEEGRAKSNLVAE